MAMDDVAREIAEIQNCQLSSEVNSMLLSSYSTDDIVLALQINQPTTSSTAHKPEEKLVQAKEAGDAIQDHRKDESPSLPSPQQSKAKRAVDPSFDDDVHPSKNSTIITSQEVQQQAMHSNPLQKGKDHDPEENTKVYRDHYVTSALVDSPESDRFSMVTMLIKELEYGNSNGNSNGEKDETIYPQKAICRHCSKLISQESVVFNTKCKCTKTSLVHEGCKDAWSLEKGDKCLHCDHKIVCTRVTVSSSEENNQITIPTKTRSWCCLW